MSLPGFVLLGASRDWASGGPLMRIRSRPEAGPKIDRTLAEKLAVGCRARLGSADDRHGGLLADVHLPARALRRSRPPPRSVEGDPAVSSRMVLAESGLAIMISVVECRCSCLEERPQQMSLFSFNHHGHSCQVSFATRRNATDWSRAQTGSPHDKQNSRSSPNGVRLDAADEPGGIRAGPLDAAHLSRPPSLLPPLLMSEG